MKRLEIRLLGGFEVRRDGEVVSAFESQKARALLAYMALHPSQPIARERLASLLWSERPDDAARRNLRQALYSLRSVLTPDREATALFEGGQRNLRFDPDLDLWVDVEAFRQAVRRGSTASGDDPRHLATAARLYRGDLLAGFFVRDCPGYEEWLLAQQEELREEAVEALRTLVAAYLSRGEPRFGIQYAKRLLSIDPLSEEAHRQLMRLYLVAGRRNSALAHYEHLRNLLNEELGVEPLGETADLYRSILLEAHAKEEQRTPQPIGPLIPLVGRSEVFELLGQSWSEVLEGHGRVTLIAGGAGVGKTRVVRSFVDVATSRRDAIVLRARCFDPTPLVSYRVFAEIFSGVYSDVLADEDTSRARLRSGTLERLVSMTPDTASTLQESLGASIEPGPTTAAESRRAVLDLLEVLSTPGAADSRPVILMIDDLQWADPPSLDLLAALAPDLAKRPVWVLATVTGDAGALLLADPPAAKRKTAIERIRLQPLTTDDLHELATALVDPDAAEDLAGFLWQRSEGVPLMLAETINYLWDTGTLVAQPTGSWQLTAAPADIVPADTVLADLVRWRFERLPTSARRLLALAAVTGQQFDVESLRLAGDEHLSVVETCIELALERWLIRQHPRRWSHVGMQQDLVLWARGARRGFFEFAHRGVRSAILDAINPLRRQIMHREVARALESRHRDDRSPVCESLAYHELGAGELARALPWLELAGARAQTAGGTEVAQIYRERAVRVIARLVEAETDDTRRAALDRRAAKLRSGRS